MFTAHFEKLGRFDECNNILKQDQANSSQERVYQILIHLKKISRRQVTLTETIKCFSTSEEEPYLADLLRNRYGDPATCVAMQPTNEDSGTCVPTNPVSGEPDLR